MSARALGIGAGWLASLGLVFVIASRPAAPPAPSTVAPSSPTRAVEPPVTLPPPSGLSAAAIRAIVREELADGGDPAVREAVEPEATSSFEPALAFVEAALARGVWTPSDRDGLRERLTGLTRGEVETLFAMIVPAANGGELRVEGVDGPLF